MQILFGAHDTIIKINSKSMNIGYIQNYISTHFTSRMIEGNTIKIPASKTDLYYRTFLLKWLYSLYSKKNGPLPELKESLIKRYHKAIKIVLPQKIIHLVTYKIIDDETLHISITPQSSKIALKIKTFLQTEIVVLSTYIEIRLKSSFEKERFKLFLKSKEIIDIPHKHVYNRQKMNEFFHKLKEEKHQDEKICPLSNAYMILNMSPTDDIKSIKKQYKYLAKKLHPDRIVSDDKELIKIHTKKFQELLASYEIILHTA